jgi:hypothetical protein
MSKIYSKWILFFIRKIRNLIYKDCWTSAIEFGLGDIKSFFIDELVGRENDLIDTWVIGRSRSRLLSLFRIISEFIISILKTKEFLINYINCKEKNIYLSAVCSVDKSSFNG